MKCPKCGYPRAKYEVNRTKQNTEKRALTRKLKSLSRKKRSSKRCGQKSQKIGKPRTDFKAFCPKCGWKGIIPEIKGFE